MNWKFWRRRCECDIDIFEHVQLQDKLRLLEHQIEVVLAQNELLTMENEVLRDMRGYRSVAEYYK